MNIKLGIIAGGGDLPRQLADHCLANGIPFHIVALRGQADRAILGYPHTYVRLGAGQQIHDALKQNGATDVVLIGTVKRPTIISLRPDWFVLKLVPRLGLFSKGDDSVLRNVVKIFEGFGMRVRGIHEFLPNLLAPAGQWTRHAPNIEQQAAIEAGIEAAKQHGTADKGQAVVMQGTHLVAAETRKGTDALLRKATGAKGAVLVKLCKPQQDRRVDLPTIGTRTVANAAAAGLGGIVVSAKATLVDDFAATVAAADAKGLFIVGVEA